ncbi:MAG TPA: tetratricopeptide repeat protein [Terriglobales bacterium]|nr:tetratricopeptide repeat protein [Terriglobales bacterium]
MSGDPRARLGLAGCAIALACALAAPALAQPLDSAAVERSYLRLQDLAPRRLPPAPAFTLLAPAEEEEGPAESQRPWTPLTAEQDLRLRQARDLRMAGQFESARAVLAPVVAAAPHHPEVVTEEARLLLARQDFAGAERLARAERRTRRDSLVVARELGTALERLGRPRDAAEVALEAWLASPRQGDWATATILRLAPADVRGVRELLRRATASRPDRQDLAIAKAQIDWRAGDLESAMGTLERAERPAAAGQAPLRWEFATRLAFENAPRDSGAAVEALTRLAADGRFGLSWRVGAARRAWELEQSRGDEERGAPALARALKDVPAARLPSDLVVSLARALRLGGHTDQARSLLAETRAAGAERAEPVIAPQLGLEEALADLRDGPPERALPRLHDLAPALPEGAWHYAEALFFAGHTDSALACYQRIAANPMGTFSGAALERIYLIEDAADPGALPAFGRVAYAEWRGDRRGAQALTDSLVRALPRGALWAQAALMLAAQREAAGDARGALAPLLAVADSLPDDRLAPLARQRAGDIDLDELKDEASALAQYEECLVRYPRAWNAPEVRRKAERLRRAPRP